MPNHCHHYLSLERFTSVPIGQALADMDEMGAGTLSLTFVNNAGRSVGGVVLLRGPETERYMEAFEAVTEELEAEEDAQEAQDKEQPHG